MRRAEHEASSSCYSQLCFFPRLPSLCLCPNIVSRSELSIRIWLEVHSAFGSVAPPMWASSSQGIFDIAEEAHLLAPPVVIGLN